MPNGDGKWPISDTTSRDYKDCGTAKYACQSIYDDKSTKCYPEDNISPDDFNSDQFCAFIDADGTRKGAKEGCCTGEDIAPGETTGTIKKGCPGACDNVLYKRPPQAYSSDRRGAPIDGDGDGDGDGSGDTDTPEEKKVKSTLTIALIWIIVLLIISTLAYIL